MDIPRFLRFIVAALTIPLVVGGNGTSVCYSREQLDDRNTLVRRITCEESEDTLYKMFPSMESVNILDLIDATCSFDELPNVLNGKFKTSDCTGRRLHDTCTLICEDDYHHTSRDEQTICQDKEDGNLAWSRGAFSCHAFNCSFEELPNVTNGSIQRSNCSGNSGGDVCNVTCDVGYYPTSLQETVCQYNGSDEGTWSNQGNLSCYAPSCPFSDLPSVTNGSFDVTACSGNSEGDVCYIICQEDYYPSLSNHTACEHIGTEIGTWTQEDFTCIAPSCPFSDLPRVTNGSFDVTACSGNSEGDVCYIICQEGYYPTLLNHTICEHTGSKIGKWTQANFSCTAPSCPFSDLPSVTNGSFDVTACSGNSEGDLCYITCQEGYYPTLSNHTICKHVGNGIGKWTQEDFSCIAKCKPSWQGHSYTWVNTKMSWADADTHCRTISSHLVYINDAEENSFVKSLTNCDGHVLPSESYASIGLIYAETVNGEIRLVGGSDNSEGRVEVFYSGVWSTVCDDGWDTTDGLIACQQLGFESVEGVYSSAYFGQGSGGILLDDVNCLGSENRLIDCQHIGFYTHNCGHHEDASVKCTLGTVNGEIRLAGGSDSSEGRVEVFYSGVWSTVCDDGWDTTHGLVTCRQLGFESVEGVYSSAYFGQGSGSILLDDINCLGSENRLIDCQHIGFYTHNCGHDEDASVKCTLEKILMWQDGAEAIYTNWISSPLQNSEYCVGIDNNGLWNIYTCESLNYFICEKESL